MDPSVTLNLSQRPAAPAAPVQQAPEVSPAPEAPARVRVDRYETEEPRVPSGTYWPEADEDGRKIHVDEAEPEAEEAAYNTDRVDRKIEQLKEQQEQLQERLNLVEDPALAAQLQDRLRLLNAELAQMDNDLYRRAHAVRT